MNKFKLIIQIISLATILSIPYYSFGTTKNIRIINDDLNANMLNNDSNMPWTVSFSTTKGNVYFTNIDESQCENSKIGHGHPKNGPCIIYPHQHVLVDYTTTEGNLGGKVIITDYTGQVYSIHYHADKTEAGASPNFEKIASTSSVQTNSPKEGDLEIQYESWADGPPCKPGYCGSE